MKKLYSLLFILLCFEGFSQSANDSMATIIFYRNPSHGASLLSIKLTDTLGNIVRLYNQSFYTYHCAPGVYTFTIAGQKNNKETIKVKAGRTYYYKTKVYQGFFHSQYEVEEADSVIANRSLARSVHMDMNKPLFRPKTRVQFTFGGSVGFKQTTFFKNAANQDVKMSFGSGVVVGGSIGREFTRHFDMEIGYRFGSGGLTPDVKGLTMDFTRHIISVTPAFVIPVDGGYHRRVRLGLGLDVYLGNKLELDMAKVTSPQLVDTWKYSDAYGYHVNVVYEVNFTPRWTLFSGFRYYSVKHHFASGTKFYPLDDFFVKPNGNGLSISMGAGFHF